MVFVVLDRTGDGFGMAVTDIAVGCFLSTTGAEKVANVQKETIGVLSVTKALIAREGSVTLTVQIKGTSVFSVYALSIVVKHLFFLDFVSYWVAGLARIKVLMDGLIAGGNTRSRSVGITRLISCTSLLVLSVVCTATLICLLKALKLLSTVGVLGPFTIA